jgi:hypothetical protein
VDFNQSSQLTGYVNPEGEGEVESYNPDPQPANVDFNQSSQLTGYVNPEGEGEVFFGPDPQPDKPVIVFVCLRMVLPSV